ncbi:MAG: hypothetical protein HQ579_04160 [Candidatus Omnitrophica bacterium]|nr:hypothetical protein [Candidatus Omnitrophota bacterium]
MNNELLILTDYIDLNRIDSSLLERCDRLGMTPSAMLAFEERGLNYLTFDDLYHYKDFRPDNTKLIKATEDLFVELDRKYESYLNFPRAFRGSIYWFLAFFADIYYISRICERMNMNYDKIYIAGSLISQASSTADLEFSLKGTRFVKYDDVLQSKVSMLRICLSPKCVWLDSMYRVPCRPDFNRYRLNYLLKQNFKKALKALKIIVSKFEPSLLKQRHKRKRAIFIIQDGYQVGLLKRYLPEFLYININPLKRLQQMKGDKGINRPNLDPLFTETLKTFVKKWFPKFDKNVFELVTLYHNDLLCKLPSFYKNLKEAVDLHKPVALLYAVGANKLHEGVCAYIANQRGIPVFYFQHGGAGTSAFYKHPYQKYVEHNENIEKINIFQSKKEKELFMQNVSTESEAMGSMDLYKLYNKF